MSDPLIIAAFLLAGVSAAGVTVDARACRRATTRAFGFSALVVKAVLAVAFVLQVLHARTVPPSVYEQFRDYVTMFALVTVGVPLVGVAVACELMALPRLEEREPQTQSAEGGREAVREA